MQYDRPYNDEINLGDVFTKFGEYWRYLLRKWWVILITALVVGFLLRQYIIWKPENYEAHSDFSVRGTEGSSTSDIASLASSFGLAIGGTSSEFTNELFLGILQSHRLIGETLCQKRTCTIKKKVETDYLANMYLDMYPRWASKKKLDDFRLQHGNIDSLTRYEDSCLNVIYDEIIDADLTVEFSDDLGMNQLTFSSTSYDFSKEFADYLANAGSAYYISTQIKIDKLNVDIIERRCDSLLSVLQGKEDMLARVQDNAAYTIKAQGLLTQGRLLRDITLMTTMYSAAYSSLEAARATLSSHTPLVDEIDAPRYATIKEKEQSILYLIIGCVLGGFLSTIVIIVRKYIRDTMAEAKQRKALIEAEKVKASQSLIDTDSNKI